MFQASAAVWGLCEHHIRPQVHWSKRPALWEHYAEELAAANPYVAKLPPLLGFIDRPQSQVAEHLGQE